MNDQFILGIIFGLILGVGLAVCWLIYRIKTIIKRLDLKVDMTEKHFLGVTVEKHDNVYRFYRAQDKQFVCQTTTLENLTELFSSQFPEKTCYVEGGDDVAVAEVKAALSQHWKNQWQVCPAHSKGNKNYFSYSLIKLLAVAGRTELI